MQQCFSYKCTFSVARAERTCRWYCRGCRVIWRLVFPCTWACRYCPSSRTVGGRKHIAWHLPLGLCMSRSSWLMILLYKFIIYRLLLYSRWFDSFCMALWFEGRWLAVEVDEMTAAGGSRPLSPVIKNINLLTSFLLIPEVWDISESRMHHGIICYCILNYCTGQTKGLINIMQP